MPTPSTPAQYALILIDMVSSQGHDTAHLLQGTSLAGSGFHGIGARVADSDFHRLVGNALELTGDAALGLHLGERLNLSAHAVLGQAFMTCRDLTQMLELFMKYYPLLSPGLELELDIRGEPCALTILAIPADFEVFGYELMAAAMLNTLRGLLGRADLSLELEFPYPEPAYGAEYRKLFGDRVRFNRPRGRICFTRELLRLTLPSSNPGLRTLYEEECARLLADLKETDSVTELTLRLLRKLEGQYPQMPQVAKMLNFSARTYRRRLLNEGQSFQQLLDSVRAEHATRHLKSTQLPLSTIAYLVGFNDVSNFRRAYRKWTGKLPQAVRLGD